MNNTMDVSNNDIVISVLTKRYKVLIERRKKIDLESSIVLNKRYVLGDKTLTAKQIKYIYWLRSKTSITA